MGGWCQKVKQHLRKATHSHTFTFEELYTLLLQLEAILNSRPLTPLSDDVNDLSVLSPGHFLIGRSLTTLPTPNFVELPMNRLQRWQRIQKLSALIWQRWSTEYLRSLQQRYKWQLPANNVRLKESVLLKETNMAPMSWRLGRIVKLHPGMDNYVLVVTIYTAYGEVKRPIHKLVRLPIDSTQSIDT